MRSRSRLRSGISCCAHPGRRPLSASRPAWGHPARRQPPESRRPLPLPAPGVRYSLPLDTAAFTGRDYAGAARGLAGALAIFTDLGARLNQASAHLGLGNLRLETGDYQAATQSLASALAIFGSFGNRLGQANALLPWAACGCGPKTCPVRSGS
jgi:hypothetical protein